MASEKCHGIGRPGDFFTERCPQINTFASLHLARGTNLLWVQQAGGWESAKMLLDVYGHYMPTESAGFADALTDLDGPMRPAAESDAPSRVASAPASSGGATGIVEPTIRFERTTCPLRVSCSTS